MAFLGEQMWMWLLLHTLNRWQHMMKPIVLHDCCYRLLISGAYAIATGLQILKGTKCNDKDFYLDAMTLCAGPCFPVAYSAFRNSRTRTAFASSEWTQHAALHDPA